MGIKRTRRHEERSPEVLSLFDPAQCANWFSVGGVQGEVP